MAMGIGPYGMDSAAREGEKQAIDSSIPSVFDAIVRIFPLFLRRKQP
jgi:hypothetical protein